jgi:thiol:disulfide interchange protein DsbD
VYELGVPSKVGDLAAVKRSGLGDSFFKGIMATILATPCSGPFLGSTLTWALAQPALTVFAVFTTVGLGMAAPYVVLTASPRLLKYVPKPGAWMQTFKHLMGFVLLATVVFLMVSVRQDYLLFTVVLLVFVALGCWWWGKFATYEQSTPQRLRTLAASAAIVAAGAWFSFGPLRGSLSGETTIAWRDFDPGLLAQLERDGTPFMIDFTADW